jgi:hypothetical protein
MNVPTPPTLAPLPPPTPTDVKPATGVTGHDLLDWTISAEFALCLLFVTLTIISLWFIKRSGFVPKDSTDVLRAYLLPVVVCVGICLIIVGYDKEQMNVVMPLLALIAGNLLARVGSDGKADLVIPPGYELKPKDEVKKTDTVTPP